jgi:uncharacterized paraquat-inducible protein A
MTLDLRCPQCGERVLDTAKYRVGEPHNATCPQCHVDLVRDPDDEDNTWEVEKPQSLLEEEPGGGD